MSLKLIFAAAVLPATLVGGSISKFTYEEIDNLANTIKQPTEETWCQPETEKSKPVIFQKKPGDDCKL